MKPGGIVLVDWRDALPGSGEPNKRRPAIVISSPQFFGSGLPFEIVVPLAGEERLAIEGASTRIDPSRENGCTKSCYALAWNVQAVPHRRITETRARVSGKDLASIRSQVASCVGE
ncbi:MAG: type II toxin-antitoxin system PemK/MazF family toxin [Candidatus Cybelea sp.]